MGIGSALGFSLNYQLSRRGECGLLAGQDRCCDSQEQHLPYDYSLQSYWTSADVLTAEQRATEPEELTKGVQLSAVTAQWLKSGAYQQRRAEPLQPKQSTHRQRRNTD